MPVKKLKEMQPIPNKLYFTIGEVGALCGLKTHVLRYWEQEFSVLNPTKRSGRRYYQRKDIIIIRNIQELLYRQGFTIEGAKAQFEQEANFPAVSDQQTKKVILDNVVKELEEVLSELKTAG